MRSDGGTGLTCERHSGGGGFLFLAHNKKNIRGWE
jgi:hypothetical protein